MQEPAKAVALCEVSTEQPDSGFTDGPQLFRKLPRQGPRTRSTTYPGLDQQLPSDREHAGETQWSTHCGDRRQSAARAVSLPPALPAPSFHPLPGALWPSPFPPRLWTLTQEQQDPEEGDTGVEVGEIVLPEV